MAIDISSSDTRPVPTLPILTKVGKDWSWPDENRFYLLTRNGPFICRRTPFFQSTVPTYTFHLGLAAHAASVQLDYPRIPKDLFETVVGFFDRIAADRQAEAVVLLTYHEQDGYDVMVPSQQSRILPGFAGDFMPVSVRYDIPLPPSDALLMGSLHSHPGRLHAFSSPMDDADARWHFPGLHFVVGELHREPPALHCLFAVDGTTLEVAQPYHLIEGYDRRRHTFPAGWLDRVAIEVLPPAHSARFRPDPAGTNPARGRSAGHPGDPA